MRQRCLAVAVALLGGLVAIEGVMAQTLSDVLGEAYTNNPRLQAERARLRATDEEVPQALSNWRPQVVVDGSAGLSSGDRDSGIDTDTEPRDIGVTISQPVFRGFRTVAELRRARNRVAAQRGTLLSTEQDVLNDAVFQFTSVVREQAVLELTRSNEGVLARNLEATQDRFRVGELTRTDVSRPRRAWPAPLPIASRRRVTWRSPVPRSRTLLASRPATWSLAKSRPACRPQSRTRATALSGTIRR